MTISAGDFVEYAKLMDAVDPLSIFHDRFAHDDSGLIYLDGNSLGRMPRATATIVDDLVERQWAVRLIRGWNEGWFDLPLRVGAKIARLIGAQDNEVIIADSTSVNLFKLAAAALRAQPGRTRIITDDLQFPSDLYILQGVSDFMNRSHTIEIIPSADGIHGPVEAIMAALSDDVALLCLSHTAFKSAYTYDLTAVTAAAHRAGALTLWDLSHSAGSTLVDLGAAHADLAVGCTYKYMNGGPGAPAYLYVRRDLQKSLSQPISGWMGHGDLFAFEPDYVPADGMRRFLSGTPSVLSLAAIESGVDLLLEAGMERIRAKSLLQTEYLVALWEQLLEPLGFRLNSPRNPNLRGSHISLGHAEAWRIDQALIHQMNVLPDFRRPDTIRLGIAPVYNRFSDVLYAAHALEQIVRESLFVRYSAVTTGVT